MKNHSFVNYLLATYLGFFLKSHYYEIYNKLDDLISFDHILSSKISIIEKENKINIIEMKTVKNEDDKVIDVIPFKV